MDFDFHKLSIEAKYRVLPFHLHVFRWNYHLVTQVSRHFKTQIFTALIMHYRKNSIQRLTEAKSPAVPVISVGQTLTTTPFGWHSPEVKVMVSWLLTQDTIFFKDQLPGHCKGKQTWKPSAADDQVPTPFQPCRFCVLSSNLFSKRNKLCDSHLPYPATTAVLSPQTPSDSTTSSLHSEDRSQLSGIHNQILCLPNTHWPSPNQNASFSTNLKSGSWNISTVSSFILFL